MKFEIKEINKYLILLAPYNLVVSTLYLLGYWKTYQVNIFEYISLSEVVILSLYRIIDQIAWLYLGILISFMIFLPLIKFYFWLKLKYSKKHQSESNQDNKYEEDIVIKIIVYGEFKFKVHH